ncbi:hemolysin III [Paracoccus sp. S-4012]|uniref:PAQR family membrane homeostasis protein TrhA n=1 Tax=Paracoccus sp. S-4012 TaxID=2665648 RepID=UPI0012AF8C22|nr:hemolysin III family protein [Paracoccus sp. S-4012]MRX52255.1 hemolysin III [Paracoccus sp. S-4012]
MDRQPCSYPAYPRAERIADGVMHATGVTLALTGAVLLTIFAALHQRPGVALAVGIYGAALTATFVVSACYHMTSWERFRPLLRRLDHAAIYLKIAGTYTPLVALMDTGFAYAVLAVVWTLALGGATSKVLFWRDPGRLGFAIYLVLGWLSLLLLSPLTATLPLRASVLVGVGGILYTAGVVFFAWKSLRFSTAIWHGFVLAASACFFAAIAMGVFTSR